MGDAADDAERRADAEREAGGGVAVARAQQVLPAPGTALARQVDRVPAQAYTSALATADRLSLQEAKERRDLVVEVMRDLMKPEVHYGNVPGVDRPALSKAGAELLGVVFKLAPMFPPDREVLHYHEGGHLDVESTCVLVHYPTGIVVAEGVGMCTTQEKKYASRLAKRTCPACQKEGSIFKSKYPPKGSPAGTPGGWWCSTREGGCGAEFHADDRAITQQELGRVPNPDLPDSWNTVRKIASKRAYTDAMLHATGASDVFTQDVDETLEAAGTPFEGGAADGTEQVAAQATSGTPQQEQAHGAARQPQQPKAADKPQERGAPAQQAAYEPVPGYTPRFQSLQAVLAYLAELSGSTQVYPWAQLMAAAVYLVHPQAPKVAKFGDLPAPLRQEAWLRMNRVADWLDEHCGAFPPPAREDVEAAMASAWEGVHVPLAPGTGQSRAERLAQIAAGNTQADGPPADSGAQAAPAGAPAPASGDAAGTPPAAAAPAQAPTAPQVPTEDEYNLAAGFVADPRAYTGGAEPSPEMLAQAQAIVDAYQAAHPDTPQPAGAA